MLVKLKLIKKKLTIFKIGRSGTISESMVFWENRNETWEETENKLKVLIKEELKM